MGTSRRLAAAVLAMATMAVLTGCSAASTEEAAEEPLIRRTFDDETTDGTAIAEAESRDDAEPTEPPAPTPLDTPVAPDEGPPLPQATGRDWDEVAQRLFDIHEAALMRRDSDLALRGMVENCTCLAEVRAGVEEARLYDVRRVPDRPSRIVEVDFLDESFTVVTLDVTIDDARVAIIDAKGVERAEREAVTYRQRWTLINDGQTDEGPWKLGIVRTLEDDEHEA